MEPWKGYALYSYSNVNTIIKLKPSSAEKIAKPAADSIVPEWMVAIRATAGDAGDVSNYFGVHPGAANEWDRYDHVEPPVIGDYVSVSFPHDDWEEYPQRYTVDFRPPDMTLEWEFDVRTNIAQEMVAVQFTGLEDIPEKYHVQIFDLDLNDRCRSPRFTRRRNNISGR